MLIHGNRDHGLLHLIGKDNGKTCPLSHSVDRGAPRPGQGEALRLDRRRYLFEGRRPGPLQGLERISHEEHQVLSPANTLTLWY